ncbi:hypothetical protein RHMOL_Rhmol03G0014100 [Rhododendron molle]|uniref:Uncharacterized protein n=1 Tax=Rhododendron molle TaxID=49168 RepID=A0ACC0PAY0_RHOML|nr:hypothetical protein RHMOL_Rhmol03G0014100 [Rhododendron molle]
MQNLSWNIRGLSKKEKRSKVKKIVGDQKVDMLLIQETKQKSISGNFIESLWGDTTYDYVEVDADGCAGGLLTVWNSDFFKLEAACCRRNFILIQGLYEEDSAFRPMNIVRRGNAIGEEMANQLLGQLAIGLHSLGAYWMLEDDYFLRWSSLADWRIAEVMHMRWLDCLIAEFWTCCGVDAPYRGADFAVVFQGHCGLVSLTWQPLLGPGFIGFYL